ncbi:type I polyketide synthase [Mycolicibacter longobardus]|uniref:Polyketide synthase n=1 Tax=Mycolicibacter longobardus TaxID=1108812 RepID=A0A1X1YPQ1_9MYCO|nr:type I polyketide synthase [Mycolicibacter longobardus]MCV7382561.1 type I polyketide synthase [Mycolicibacter longobardus]ORW13096.1 polyketide synthase [Mycolicibacter longobardus]
MTAPRLHPHDAAEPIAVVGIGCRLAGDVTTPTDFWTFLLDGRSAVRQVPAERWEPYLRRDPRNAAVLRATTPWGTFLDDLAGFDAEFFGVSPREAELMDPQQRLAVEVCWEALEHAGIAPRSLAGSDTAVLMGVNADDYGKLIMEDLPGIEAWTGIGTALCGVANRVSHLLDLRGPSVALDAACAASLVAVQQACQQLRAGETSLALAGGVSALIGPGLTRVLDQAGATAPDGRSKTFDMAADGYGRGEGAAVVVLKRLSDARRDGNRVWALVRGGAVAHDGNTAGIMSPNGAAQEDLFRLACESADIEPTSVGFVEAHGTGTPVGDRVELAALAAVYGAGRPTDAPCLVGSVKPNTGHLEGGAGVVGLIKAVLALDQEKIPPTAGISKLTTAINWAASGLRVATEVEAWPRQQDSPRRAAVCSYGYGGTIAHIVLEEAPLQPASHLVPDPAAAPAVVPVSARSHARLARQAEALAGHLRTGDHSLDQVAATLWTRRSHERVRAAVLADSCEELVAGLDALANDAQQPAVATGAIVPGASGGAVWVFSGHGSQWEGMGRELLANEPAFATVIDEIDPVFQAELGFSAREALSTGELGTTDRVQALTFAIQAGLAALLRDRGITPAAVIGHSVGEVAACVAAGVLDLAQGAKVACYRARGFRSVAGHGAMALVGLSFEEARRRLCQGSDVVAAISSTPESTVVSGTVEAIDQVCQRCSEEGVSVRRVNTDVAFHSPQMDALTGDLARLTAGLPPAGDADVPLYTTALADPRSTAPRDSNYWVANLRGQVRFAEAVIAAAQDGHRLFLEISAHPVVSHSVLETLLHMGVDQYGVVPTLRRQQPERRAVTHALAALYCHGAPFPHGLTADSPWTDNLPVTQWQHQHFWRTPTPPPVGGGIHDVDTHTLLGGSVDITSAVPARMWQTRLEMSNRPYPGDHPVQGTEIVPAAVLLNTMLTAATTNLVDVRLRTPVAPGRTRDLQVVLQEHCLSVSSRIVESDDAPTDGGWLTHCTAVAEVNDNAAAPVFDIAAVQQRCTDVLPSTHVIDILESLGVAAMGFEWEIRELRRGDRELLARVSAEPDGSVPPTWAGLLDAATSTASVLFSDTGRLKMPARVERVAVHGPPCGEALLHARRCAQGTITDVVITDLTGTVLVSMTGLAFEDLERTGDRELSRLVHRLAWHPTPWSEDDRPAHVTLIGGVEATRQWCTRDLAAAGVPTRSVADPADLPSGDGPDAGAVVLVLTEPHDEPSVSIDVVLRTLKHLVGQHSKARLWVLTRNVHEGTDIEQSPLWGLSRVAAAEQPQVWGGVLDLSESRLPVPALSSLTGHGVVVVRDGIAHTARLAPAPCAGEPMRCSPGGTYLITGGTGALGRQMAHRLVDLGARRLVLVSRSGLPDRAPADAATSPELVQTVRSLEERGVFVRVAAIDIGAPGAAAALQLALTDLPPVLGVVHAAGIETGALLTDTTLAQVNASMHAKVTGALVLDEVFPPGMLDWMLLFSSCGYLTGFPGQGAYACGNAFLDAFARQRRNLGDRTVSVAWTAWRGLGMGSTSEYVAAQLESMGMETISADDAMWALDLAMRDDQANAVVLPVTPLAASVAMLADIAPVESDVAESDDPLQTGLPEDPAEASDWVAERVSAAIAGQLGLPEDGVDPYVPLIEMGVDSIMTVAVRRRLEKQTGLTLSPTLLWEHPTAAAVTKKILELLG